MSLSHGLISMALLGFDTSSRVKQLLVEGGVVPGKSGEVCAPLPKTLTLFKTKLCDFLYRIYDLTKHLKS